MKFIKSLQNEVTKFVQKGSVASKVVCLWCCIHLHRLRFGCDHRHIYEFTTKGQVNYTAVNSL